MALRIEPTAANRPAAIDLTVGASSCAFPRGSDTKGSDEHVGKSCAAAGFSKVEYLKPSGIALVIQVMIAPSNRG